MNTYMLELSNEWIFVIAVCLIMLIVYLVVSIRQFRILKRNQKTNTSELLFYRELVSNFCLNDVHIGFVAKIARHYLDISDKTYSESRDWLIGLALANNTALLVPGKILMRSTNELDNSLGSYNDYFINFKKNFKEEVSLQNSLKPVSDRIVDNWYLEFRAAYNLLHGRRDEDLILKIVNSFSSKIGLLSFSATFDLYRKYIYSFSKSQMVDRVVGDTLKSSMKNTLREALESRICLILEREEDLLKNIGTKLELDSFIRENSPFFFEKFEESLRERLKSLSEEKFKEELV
jgi:hypothetical protein